MTNHRVRTTHYSPLSTRNRRRLKRQPKAGGDRALWVVVFSLRRYISKGLEALAEPLDRRMETDTGKP